MRVFLIVSPIPGLLELCWMTIVGRPGLSGGLGRLGGCDRGWELYGGGMAWEPDPGGDTGDEYAGCAERLGSPEGVL